MSLYFLFISILFPYILSLLGALSPPGRGYDCGRTWQVLAVGSVPLVLNDDRFDQRLHAAGPQWMPPAEQLSPELLATILTRSAWL